MGVKGQCSELADIRVAMILASHFFSPSRHFWLPESLDGIGSQPPVCLDVCEGHFLRDVKLGDIF